MKSASYVYKVRKSTTKHPTARNAATYALTVPNEVAERVPEGTRFVLSVTDEGLFYRPLTIESGGEGGDWLDASR